MGIVYGPLGAWLPTLYAVPVRYTGVSVAFNAGGIIGGAVAPNIAQLLATGAFGLGGGAVPAGYLLSVAGAISLIGIVSVKAARRA
jgi:hypothetical protein